MTNQVAFEEGMGKDGIEVVGERLEEIRIPRFRLPAPSQPDWDLPRFLQKALKNALTSKPVVDEEVCNACNRCLEICPPKVLSREERGLVFDYGKCIRCFCCQEVCPEGAISIKPGWAMKLVGSRQKAVGSRQKAVGSRQKAVGR
jgi:ferredoxin